MRKNNLGQLDAPAAALLEHETLSRVDVYLH